MYAYISPSLYGYMNDSPKERRASSVEEGSPTSEAQALAAYLSSYQSFHLFIYPPIHLSIYLSICLYMYACMHVCMHVSLSPSLYGYMNDSPTERRASSVEEGSPTTEAQARATHLSSYQSIHLFIYPPIYLSIYLSIYPSVYICMYVCMYLSLTLYGYMHDSPKERRASSLEEGSPTYEAETLAAYLSSSQYIHLFIYPPIHLSIYLSIYVCMHLRMYVCISPSLYGYTNDSPKERRASSVEEGSPTPKADALASAECAACSSAMSASFLRGDNKGI